MKAEITIGNIFRRVSKKGVVGECGLRQKRYGMSLKPAAQRAGILNLAPHDLCATMSISQVGAGANPISPGPRLPTDDRTLSWL